MRVNLPIFYSQIDSRWASKLLGFNKDSQYNFYNYACLIVCLAMVSRYYGFEETPITINDKLVKLGAGNGFAAGTGNYVWGSITKLIDSIKERLVITSAPLTDAQYGEIRSSLDAGHPVMLQIDVNPKTVANDTHYVLAIDYNPSDENDLTIADPLTGKPRSLKDYLGWYRPSMRKTVEKYILFTGKKPDATVSGCLLPNTEGNQKVYAKLVHNSTEWDKTVAEYLPDTDPASRSFEDVRNVVNGHKSRATDMENQKNKALESVALAEIEVKNQKDKLANVEAECQRTIAIKNAEIEALSGNAKAFDKLRGEYTEQIEALQTELREAQKAKGLAETAKTEADIKLKTCQNGQKAAESTGVLAKLLELLLGHKQQ